MSEARAWSLERARLRAAPYIIFKDSRHGWEAVPFQNSSAARMLTEPIPHGLKSVLAFWSTCFRQSGFLSQLRIDFRQIFPEPLVALPAQQRVLPVVLPAPLQGTLLLSSDSFFHP